MEYLPFLMLPVAFTLMFLGIQVAFALMITAVLFGIGIFGNRVIFQFIEKIEDISSNFVFAAGFYSTDNSPSNQYTSNYLDVYVKDALKRIPGVGDVVIFGEHCLEVRAARHRRDERTHRIG